MDADVIIVGAGLAGLVAARELVAAGRRVIVVDQQGPQDLGGQAFWSFGGLFLVDSPEQRRLRVRDSFDLAWADWQGSAQFDRLADEDIWARRWARSYVEWAATEKRSWLRARGIALLPTVGWAERGDLTPGGHGNSVPRFHIAWGTGTGVVGPFVHASQQASATGQLRLRHRHQVAGLTTTGGAVTGVRGHVLAHDDAPRGAATRDDIVGEFALSAPAVIVASGGIGGNHDLVRRWWPTRLGQPPANMITGVPGYVDGRMIEVVEQAGGRLVNRDRMWHYVEGVHNWDPVWERHAIRILPGPSSLWLDALGRRLPNPYLPGYDTLGTLRHLRTTPDLTDHDHSWFLLTRKVFKKEFALSGSEQNADITSRDLRAVLRERLLTKGPPPALQAFLNHGADFVTAPTLELLVERMNSLTDVPLLDPRQVREQVEERDAQTKNKYSKDAQAQGIANSRRYLGDRLGRVASPHRLLDPSAGPLIAVKLHVLTRKSLGGIHTDLDTRVLGRDGTPVTGLYAIGEAAGFGGGGAHGYNSLEGTFLGNCLYGGLKAGQAVAEATR